MPEDNLSDQYYEIRILFKKSDQLKWATYYNEIDKLVKAGKSVPAPLLEKWFGYFNSYENLIETKQKEEGNKKINDLTKAALSFLKNNPDYNFNGKKSVKIFLYQRPPINGVSPTQRTSYKKTIPYSLESIIHSCLKSFMYQHRIKAITKKRDAILFFFNHIETYSKEHFNKLHLKELTKYKKQVIAGILTHVTGIIVINETMKFTNEKIYQQIRHYFQPKTYNKSIKKKKP